MLIVLGRLDLIAFEAANLLAANAVIITIEGEVPFLQRQREIPIRSWVSGNPY